MDMNWDLMIAEYNSGLEVLAAILALVIFVSSLDDLFIDIWYWARRIFRRARVERCPQLQRVQVPHPGPTSKADCLNAVVAAIFDHERETGTEFAGVVLHDSE